MKLTTATTLDQGSRWRTGVASGEYSGAAAGCERIGPRRGVAPSAFTAFGTLAVHEAQEVYGTERPVATTVEPRSHPEVVASESIDPDALEADSLDSDSLEAAPRCPGWVAGLGGRMRLG